LNICELASIPCLKHSYRLCRRAVGDFSGDGKPDLAATYQAYRTDGYVTVLYPKRDGTLEVAAHFAGAAAPMVAADLNRDGKLDLVGRLILLGKGNGTFQSGVPSGLGEDFAALAVSDFNGDGKPDVATIISDRPSGVAPVRVYLGNDDGSLRWAGGYSANTDPVAIEVRDFNGDSRPDLAVANRGSRGQSVSVLLGSGDGTFQGAVSFDVKPPISLAGGDFNGDGKPDLVVGHLDSSNVSVWLNKGDGSFSAAAEYRAALNPFSLAVGDLNGDGRLDLAVGNKGNYLDDGCVSILLGKGDGTFAAAVNYAEGTEPAAVAFGDFNGDGKPDLAVAISGSHTIYWFHDSVRVLLGNGDGTFQAPRLLRCGQHSYFPSPRRL